MKTKFEVSKVEAQCGRDQVGPFSRFFLCWMNDMMFKAQHYSYDLVDLPAPPNDDKARNLSDRAERKWKGMKGRIGKNGENLTPSLFKLLWRLHGLTFLEGSFCAFGMGFMRIVQNILVGQLLKLDDRDPSFTSWAYTIAGGIAASSVIEAFLIHHWTISTRHAGMKARATCAILMYKRIVGWKKCELSQMSTGQIINLFGHDMGIFDERIRFLPLVFIAPIELLANLGVMWWLIGWYAAPGIAYLLVFLGIHVVLGKLFSSLRRKANVVTDDRIQLTTDVLNGIKLIKMYAWEYPMQNLINTIRHVEMKYVSRSTALRAFLASIFNVTGRVAFFFILLPYVVTGHSLQPDIIFTMTTFCYVLRAVAGYLFPAGAAVAAETYVSIKRIDAFLNFQPKKKKKSRTNNQSTPLEPGILVDVRNLMCSWQQSPREDSFGSVSFRLRRGELLAVVGSVGSGKTTLLMSLLGEITTVNNTVQVSGKIAYVPQESWVIAGTILDNIIFGSAYDEDKFKKVVQVCALSEDLKNFPEGQMTMVGQKGTMMSGGQRARINLARAVYSDADIYLLDDPLSAVDAKVSRHLFEQCICGHLKTKAVVLVTHQIQYLPQVSSVIVLNKGLCTGQGSYAELLKSGIQFSHVTSEEEEQNEEDQQQVQKTSVKRRSTIRSNKSDFEDIQPLEGDLMDSKEMNGAKDFKATGFVSFRIHWEYLTKDAGVFVFLLLILFVVLFQTLGVGVDYWLKYWVSKEKLCNEIWPNATKYYQDYQSQLSRMNKTTTSQLVDITWCDTSRNLYVYIGLLGSSLVATVVALLIGNLICKRASIGYHTRLLHSILRARPFYFDVQPIGNFQNRFSMDMADIDYNLPMSLFDVFVLTGGCIAPLIIVCIENQWLIIPSVVLAIFYCKMCVVHIKACGNFKRLEGIARSPMYSHLTSTILGLPVIHAQKKEEVMLNLFEKHLDKYSSAIYHYVCANCWVTSKIQVADALNVVCVVFVMAYFIEQSGRASIGLVMTMTFMLMPLLWWNVIRIGEGEDQLTAVERLRHYVKLEPEAELESSTDLKPPESWPEKGSIVMDKVSVQYHQSNNMALKNLTVQIQNGEKVGIVGRTGAGKSSLITTIFRLTEPTGAINIDGVLVNEIGLHCLRKNLSVIPQDPIMFAGSVRRNLDPFDNHTDEQLMNVLEDVNMKQVILTLSGGLEADVQEGGAAFSIGQRQLLCIARAILRNNKILLLDEATANIDNRMDTFIQETIRRKFKNCTILTVAHRLSTIMDYDRVMVLHKGEIMEFDEPYELLQNKGGHFYNLVQSCGMKTQAALTRIAEEAHEARSTNRNDTGVTVDRD